MISTDTQAQILQHYDRERSNFQELGALAEGLIKSMLVQKNLPVHSVSHRCKERDSLARKLNKPDKHYATLDDLTDISGVRVITYFDEDVDQLAHLIEQLFAVDTSNSIDKRKLLELNSFGYQSLHFIVSLSSERCHLPENQRFAGRRFEIQIRSILQHAWAEIEHDLGYKSEEEVSDKIRRRFARVAGLLELADAEFTAIRGDLLKREKVSYEQALPAPLNQQAKLSLSQLRAAYESSRDLRILDRAVTQVAHAKLNRNSNFVLERAVARLAFLGIQQVSELERLAKQYLPQVETFAKLWMAGDTYASLEIGVGSTYLCYVLVGEKNDRQLAIDYLNQTSTAGSKLREKMADNILAMYAKLAF